MRHPASLVFFFGFAAERRPISNRRADRRTKQLKRDRAGKKKKTTSECRNVGRYGKPNFATGHKEMWCILVAKKSAECTYQTETPISLWSRAVGRQPLNVDNDMLCFLCSSSKMVERLSLERKKSRR